MSDQVQTADRSDADLAQSPAPRSAHGQRDRELVEALRRRDPGAAELLLAAYGDRAYRLAMRITRCEPDAEEVIQDAFWTVVRKIDTWRGEAAFGSWLYRIVANAAYQKLRGRPRGRADIALDDVMPFFDERGRHGEPVTDWSPMVEDPHAQAELRAALVAAIDELPEDYRAVLVLRYVEGLSNPEIGQILGLSLANVKSRVHRARLFLRKRLSDWVSPSASQRPELEALASAPA